MKFVQKAIAVFSALTLLLDVAQASHLQALRTLHVHSRANQQLIFSYEAFNPEALVQEPRQMQPEEVRPASALRRWLARSRIVKAGGLAALFGSLSFGAEIKEGFVHFNSRNDQFAAFVRDNLHIKPTYGPHGSVHYLWKAMWQGTKHAARAADHQKTIYYLEKIPAQSVLKAAAQWLHHVPTPLKTPSPEAPIPLPVITHPIVFHVPSVQEIVWNFLANSTHTVLAHPLAPYIALSFLATILFLFIGVRLHRRISDRSEANADNTTLQEPSLKSDPPPETISPPLPPLPKEEGPFLVRKPPAPKPQPYQSFIPASENGKKVAIGTTRLPPRKNPVWPTPEPPTQEKKKEKPPTIEVGPQTAWQRFLAWFESPDPLLDPDELNGSRSESPWKQEMPKKIPSWKFWSRSPSEPVQLPLWTDIPSIELDQPESLPSRAGTLSWVLRAVRPLTQFRLSFNSSAPKNPLEALVTPEDSALLKSWPTQRREIRRLPSRVEFLGNALLKSLFIIVPLGIGFLHFLLAEYKPFLFDRIVELEKWILWTSDFHAVILALSLTFLVGLAMAVIPPLKKMFYGRLWTASLSLVSGIGIYVLSYHSARLVPFGVEGALGIMTLLDAVLVWQSYKRRSEPPQKVQDPPAPEAEKKNPDPKVTLPAPFLTLVVRRDIYWTARKGLSALLAQIPLLTTAEIQKEISLLQEGLEVFFMGWSQLSLRDRDDLRSEFRPSVLERALEDLSRLVPKLSTSGNARAEFQAFMKRWGATPTHENGDHPVGLPKDALNGSTSPSKTRSSKTSGFFFILFGSFSLWAWSTHQAQLAPSHLLLTKA
jgi:hypothetical protein